MRRESLYFNLISLLLFGLMAGVPSHAQQPAAAATPAELVLQGKALPAARLAAKTPGLGKQTLSQLLAKSDVQVTERQIPDALATLKHSADFVREYEKLNRKEPLPKEALNGRQLRLQGIQLSDKKEYEKATDTLQKALALSKKAADPALEAGVHNNLGYALLSLGKQEEASSEYTIARDMAETQKDDARAGSYGFNLGLALYELKKFEPAFTAFKRSAEANQRSKNAGLEARAVFWQARALSDVSKVSDEPVKLFSKAQAMFEKLGDDRNAARCLYHIGDHIAYTFKFAEAARYGERAVPLFLRSDDRDGLVRCYELLADMYSRLDKKDRSPESEAAKKKSEEYKKKAQELVANR